MDGLAVAGQGETVVQLGSGRSHAMSSVLERVELCADEILEDCDRVLGHRARSSCLARCLRELGLDAEVASLE